MVKVRRFRTEGRLFYRKSDGSLSTLVCVDAKCELGDSLTMAETDMMGRFPLNGRFAYQVRISDVLKDEVNGYRMVFRHWEDKREKHLPLERMKSFINDGRSHTIDKRERMILPNELEEFKEYLDANELFGRVSFPDKWRMVICRRSE